MRISWEDYALDLAKTASQRSEDPHMKVGACALNKQNMVLALGYNGLAPRKEVMDFFWKDRDLRRPYMIHAEANCLSLVKRGEVSLLAVTLLPCASCATLIASYDIPEVVYGETYERDTKALEIFDFYGIKCVKKNLTKMTKMS
jgi:dCMP deaminase|tara:strand:+ start:3351 stop:3782 length:432 start_codon:yes stop_codon:yes gene_type:complete